MGLDLNFYKAKRQRLNEVNDEYQEICKQLNAEYRKPENEFDMDKADELEKKQDMLNPWEEVAYFRKVNFLIPFFGYKDNCSELEIDKCQIEDLVDACKEVLDYHDNAEELLPTTPGFFFGSTEYNDDYFDNVEEVKSTFEGILEDLTDDDVIQMHCWW